MRAEWGEGVKEGVAVRSSPAVSGIISWQQLAVIPVFAQGPRHGLDQRRAQMPRKAAAPRCPPQVWRPAGTGRGCSEGACLRVRPPAAQVDFTPIASWSLNDCMSLKQQAATQIQVRAQSLISWELNGPNRVRHSPSLKLAPED